MSWTTTGVFSFWPTRSTSPGLAFGWLALDDDVHVRRPLPRQPAGGDLELAVAEGDDRVVALVGDRSAATACATSSIAWPGAASAARDRRRAASSPRPWARTSRRCRSAPGGWGRRRRSSARARRTRAGGRPRRARAAAGRSRCRRRARARPACRSPGAACGSGSSSRARACCAVEPTSIRAAVRRPARFSSSARSCRRLYPPARLGSGPHRESGFSTDAKGVFARMESAPARE